VKRPVSRSRTRWAVLAAFAVIVAACGGGSTSGGTSDRSPIKVGFMVPLTGPVSGNAKAEQQGFDLGLKDFGSTVNGRTIQVSYADTQNDPTVALAQARQLVENQAVDIMEGPLASNEIGAVAPYLGARGIPTDDLAMCSSQQLDLYPKFGVGFSSGWACSQPSLMGGQYAARDLHWKHAVIVALDFSFGWLNAGGFAAAFKANGGTVDKFIWNPITQTDFAPVVSQIPQNTEGVYVVESGQTAIRFTDAFRQFGLKGKVPVIGITQLTDYSALPAESPASALGLQTNAQYCDGIATANNTKFVDEYHSQYNTYPGYYSDAGYTKARLLITALKKLNGVTKNKKAVASAMRSTPIVSSRGPVRLSGAPAFAPIQNIYMCEVKQVGGALRNVPVKTYTAVKPWGSLSQSAWEAEFRRDSNGRPA
jgi:branched-chain amino acid transport system substrate-binding protein